MKKLLRSLFWLLLIALIIIIAILILNTVNYASKQTQYDQVEKIAVPEAAVSRLAQVVQFPTVSFENSIDTAAFIDINKFIVANYPMVDSLMEPVQINEFSTIFKLRGRNVDLKPILLMGHLDVVPVDEASMEKWTVPPFSGEQKDGYIWGRGTMDDKITCFGLLESMEMLLQKDFVPERTIYFAFGHDEEVGGKQGAVTIANKFRSEKIEFEYIMDEGMLILEKPMTGLDKTTALIGIAEKGYTTLTLTVNLDGGHSSMPPTNTAIGLLSKAINKLETNPFPAKINGATAELFQHIGPEMTLLNKVIFSNLWLFKGVLKNKLSKIPSTNALIRTTTATTMIRGGVRENVLASQASAKINFRILPEETIESVKAYVKKTIDDDRVIISENVENFSNNPSAVSSTDCFGYKVIQRSVKQIKPDVLVAPALMIGATDARHFAGLSDNIYRFLPTQIVKDDLSRIHGIDERISKESYKQIIQIYYQLILNSCK